MTTYKNETSVGRPKTPGLFVQSMPIHGSMFTYTSKTKSISIERVLKEPAMVFTMRDRVTAKRLSSKEQDLVKSRAQRGFFLSFVYVFPVLFPLVQN